MLKNAYLDAKIGFHTEENEPSEICGIGSWYMYLRKCLPPDSQLAYADISQLRGPGPGLLARKKPFQKYTALRRGLGTHRILSV